MRVGRQSLTSTMKMAGPNSTVSSLLSHEGTTTCKTILNRQQHRGRL